MKKNNTANLKKVDLFIGGTQKAGTSSLTNYLAQHPDIFSSPMEMMYFVSDNIYERGYPNAFERYYSNYANEKILLAKSVGLMYSEEAMQRLFKHNPLVKIILILRNPVDRAYSAFYYAKQMAWETSDTFEEAIHKTPDDYDDFLAKRNCQYLEMGTYHKYIKKMHTIFPRENVSFFFFEDMINDLNGLCNQIFHIIQVTPFEVIMDKRYNPARAGRFPKLMKYVAQPSRIPGIRRFIRSTIPGKIRDKIRKTINKINSKEIEKKPLNPETRLELIEYFQPHNMELEKLIHRDLSQWNTP